MYKVCSGSWCKKHFYWGGGQKNLKHLLGSIFLMPYISESIASCGTCSAVCGQFVNADSHCFHTLSVPTTPYPTLSHHLGLSSAIRALIILLNKSLDHQASVFSSVRWVRVITRPKLLAVWEVYLWAEYPEHFKDLGKGLLLIPKVCIWLKQFCSLSWQT